MEQTPDEKSMLKDFEVSRLIHLVNMNLSTLKLNKKKNEQEIIEYETLKSKLQELHKTSI